MSLERRTPLKRSPLKASATQMKRVPIKRTNKRKADVEFSPEVREQVQYRAHGRCEICKEAPIHQYHHRRLRAQGGKGTLTNCLGLCAKCHTMVHSAGDLAYENGWLIRIGGA